MEDDSINFHQAMKISNSQKWIDTMNEEIKSMKDNDIWDLIPFPKDAKPIVCSQVFKTKRDSMGDVKAHLIAKEFTDKEGIDIERLFQDNNNVNGTF